MTRIMLLTSPLVTNEGDLKKSAVNNGLFYLGSYLRNNKHDVKLEDVIFEGWNNIRYKKDNITEYGLSNEDINKKIEDYNPDIIGVNLLASVDYGGFLSMIKQLKKNFLSKIIIAGGSHVSALPEKTLRDSEKSLDYIVHGEGELVIKKIMDNLNPNYIKKLNGIAYLDDNNNFQINPQEELIKNLDSVGDLAIDLVEKIPFTKEPTYAGSAYGKKYVDLMLSRGCPNNCGFCFTPQMWGRIFRTHSINWISRTLDNYIKEGFEHFIIQDDNFSRGKEWAYEIMNLFKEKNVTWENNGGLEMEDLTPEIIKHMAKTNCKTLFIPINLRTEYTDVISDNLKNHYKNILSEAKRGGMYVYTSHIMGFPEQTLAGMQRQSDFAKKLVDGKLSDFHVVYAFSVLPGTHRWNQIMKPVGRGEYQVKKESKINFHGGWQNWPLYSINSPQIGGPNFSFDELKKLYFNSIKYINGKKADAWFEGREWPK